MGRHISLSQVPKRIISLVPSQTELLFDLGLEKEVVGLTKFCIYPGDKVKDKIKIGGTKSYRLDRIKELKPDLIIGNKEENDKKQVEALMKEYPVWMSDIKDLESALEMIEKLGLILEKSNEAIQLSSKIKTAFTKLPTTNRPLKTAYFIWKKPYMVAGNGTFIQEMLHIAGFQNVFASQDRYPKTSLEELKSIQPEVILLSSEPYPFAQKHIDEFKKVCPNAIVRLVDGELFSWYGSRLLKAPSYFKQLLVEVRSLLS